MTFVTVDKVNYYSYSDYLIVGNNSTISADGISDISYNGEIVIHEKINNKKVLEVAQKAFDSSLITKVTIYAKLRNINLAAFDYCTKLEYINIPSTCTFIGDAALFFGQPGTNFDLQVLVEFNKGRTQNLFIDRQNFARRTTLYVIYPSEFVPIYSDTSYAFLDVTNYAICAPKQFNFYTKQTTTNNENCPAPVFVDKKSYTLAYKIVHNKRRFRITFAKGNVII